MSYRSNLERILMNRWFAVTAEICPPKGSDPSRIKQKGDILRGCADAFNVTDNQTAVVRMSSIAGSVILSNMGLEPIMQITCRDRNRIALQSEVLGAYAVGIRNMLFITGDHQSFGNHPSAKGVYDLDSIQLIHVVKNMRDNGLFQNGEEILFGKPDIFIGAAANPFVDPYEMGVDRLEKKITAGTDFIQTQSVFNLERFNEWMDEVRARGLDKKISILAGVTPLKSLKMTMRMKYHVPGVDVPDEIVNRMKNTRDQKKEGYEIAVEILREIRRIRGVHGVHITALFWEDIIPFLVKNTGLFPRP
ncbi:5,10-methylenetetrahydrofolate reductase [Euryarchaeota archaeon ex4484_162]|nr:MAG: 5,10-methylenetetrahydrofolate reductase [Euryarchaeota archaeon ex4484_162]RLF29398.1 MAG: methylenetetrahydrofolate reductase [Thermoplasmata archaeon]